MEVSGVEDPTSSRADKYGNGSWESVIQIMGQFASSALVRCESLLRILPEPDIAIEGQPPLAVPALPRRK